MCLPPCHYSFQFFVNDKTLSLLFSMRSVDLVLGLPFDIAYYALLCHLVAKECNLNLGELIVSLGDCHIYENHLDVVKLMLTRKPYPLPTLHMYDWASIDAFNPHAIHLVGYKYHASISAELNTG